MLRPPVYAGDPSDLPNILPSAQDADLCRTFAADLHNPPMADLAGMAGHKICRRITVRLHAVNISFCEEVVADSEDRNI